MFHYCLKTMKYLAEFLITIIDELLWETAQKRFTANKTNTPVEMSLDYNGIL